jgi:hypothetical protein
MTPGISSLRAARGGAPVTGGGGVMGANDSAAHDPTGRSAAPFRFA